MIKLKDILIEDDIPYKIGFAQKGKQKPAFERGLVDEFFKFFYQPPRADAPTEEGGFMKMAIALKDRYPDQEFDELQLIVEVCNEINSYFMDPIDKAGYSLSNLTQKGGAEAVYNYMQKVNKLADKVYQGTVRGGAAEPNKIKQGLKGILGLLEKAKDIFTASFGPPKRKKIGFKFSNESINKLGIK
jgi:hypothetical protein